uniref:hypothetical protein n=1 Tax=Mycobacterium sp. TaxID=1785 RepID=UPI003F9932F9
PAARAGSAGRRTRWQLSDFGRPRASPCNDTPYESEITTARLKLKSQYARADEADVLFIRFNQLATEAVKAAPSIER